MNRTTNMKGISEAAGFDIIQPKECPIWLEHSYKRGIPYLARVIRTNEDAQGIRNLTKAYLGYALELGDY